MAKRDTNGSARYWYEGSTSTLLASRSITNIGTQLYWYNGSPQGYLPSSIFYPITRQFAILIGF
jgi:hypothetical protein